MVKFRYFVYTLWHMKLNIIYKIFFGSVIDKRWCIHYRWIILQLLDYSSISTQDSHALHQYYLSRLKQQSHHIILQLPDNSSISTQGSHALQQYSLSILKRQSHQIILQLLDYSSISTQDPHALQKYSLSILKRQSHQIILQLPRIILQSLPDFHALQQNYPYLLKRQSHNTWVLYCIVPDLLLLCAAVHAIFSFSAFYIYIWPVSLILPIWYRCWMELLTLLI